MGSSDIYGPVEQLEEIAEALVVGVEQDSGGYWMPLFVTTTDGIDVDDVLSEKIRDAILHGASPRHVPDEIIQAPGIPHTRTGKKLEFSCSNVCCAETPSAPWSTPAASTDPNSSTGTPTSAPPTVRATGTAAGSVASPSPNG
ncbi:hypothetical protein ABR738_01700 [Streptomyces sp. Edi4]|uniref:AMP-binding enzyme n=1 Tax=Streptomyces sp. Edi4 TaxID=3162527 RepID=UPI0033067F63